MFKSFLSFYIISFNLIGQTSRLVVCKTWFCLFHVTTICSQEIRLNLYVLSNKKHISMETPNSIEL